MEGIKLEAGKFYRTRDGRKAFVVFVQPPEGMGHRYPVLGYHGEYSGNWTSDGKWNDGGESQNDLVAEWLEPRRISGWVCVWDFPGALVIVHPSEAAAKQATMGDRKKLAIAFIDVLEGQGLDGSAR